MEGITNQTHQANIYSLCEPSNPKMFFINSTIWLLHTNKPPKTLTKTICFGLHCHNHSTTNVYPTQPVYQNLQQRFQPAVTSCQVIVDNTTADTPLMKKMAATFPNFFPSYATRPSRATPWLIKKKEINLNLTAYINHSRPIIPAFHHIDTSRLLLLLLSPSMG